MFDRLCRKCCLWAKGHCFKQWEHYRSQKPVLAINDFPESWAFLPQKQVWCWFVGPGRRRGAWSSLPINFTTDAGPRVTCCAPSVCPLLNFQSVLWDCFPNHIITVLYSMRELQSQLSKKYSWKLILQAHRWYIYIYWTNIWMRLWVCIFFKYEFTCCKTIHHLSRKEECIEYK